MKYFYGEKKKSGYFEGWYLKHQKDGQMISFIPAYHVDAYGKASASLQVIMKDNTYCIEYPIETFCAKNNRFSCHIGGNVFSENGCILDIQTEEVTIKGELKYGEFVTPKSDIMGPFRMLWGMQCRHGILSLSHPLKGELTVNGEKMDFTRGMGYIEKDRGTSFPNAYQWMQCSWYDKGPASMMLAIAEVPVGMWNFTGCIGSIYYRGEEHRIATYLGAKILKNDAGVIWIRQGKYRLLVKIGGKGKQALKAPEEGSMSREVKESLACDIECRLYREKELLLHLKDRHASAE